MAFASSDKKSTSRSKQVGSSELEMQPSSDLPGEVIARSAGAVSAGVLASRVLGLVREQVLAYLFSAKIGLDAFYAAFRIPNLLRDMFGEGALSKAFVTTISEINEKEGEEAAFRLVNLVLNLIVLLMGMVTFLGIYYADSIVGLAFPGDGFDTPIVNDTVYGSLTKRELTVALTRVMFPFVFLVSLAALAMGVLNARGRFLVPALASAFFNVGAIVVGVIGYFLAPRYGHHPATGMAFGVLFGGLLQLLWQLPFVVRLGYRYRLIFSLRDRNMRKVIRLFAPGALIASTVQVNLFVNSIFASRGEGWLTWMIQAFRILHLPLGLIAVAVSIATLPALSRAAARSDDQTFKDTFSVAMRLVILFTVPATIGLLVLAVPIARLIFEQGRFGPEDTLQVAAALRFYAIGLLSFAGVKIINDGFYALQDIRAPLIVSLASMVFNVFTNWLFVIVLGMDHRGLALSTSLTTTISLVALWILFSKRVGELNIDKVLGVLFKTAVISLLMGAVALMTFSFTDSWLGHEFVWARMVSLLGSIFVSILVFVYACKILRIKEFEQAFQTLMPSTLR